VRPLLHYDASTKASLAFNSVPTFPRIDFGCGCLLSFCFYGLLETPQLPATPRPYGNGLSVLAQSEIRHLTYATSCRTSGSQTVSDGLANKGCFRLTFRANKRRPGLTITANKPTFSANSLQTMC
jgi:hypothetical protein